jgi:hypothetical protein
VIEIILGGIAAISGFGLILAMASGFRIPIVEYVYRPIVVGT